MGVSKNRVRPPNHPFVHRVFHYFHHPFWGYSTPIFGLLTPIYLWDSWVIRKVGGLGEQKPSQHSNTPALAFHPRFDVLMFEGLVDQKFGSVVNKLRAVFNHVVVFFLCGFVYNNVFFQNPEVILNS